MIMGCLDVRVLWCKTQATAERWEEEKKLVMEEMRRTLDFFGYYVKLWRGRAANSDDSDGSKAYSKK